MRYLITVIFGFAAFLFMLAVGKSVYMTFTDNPYWIFVAVGVFLPAIVLTLIASAAYSAAKEY